MMARERFPGYVEMLDRMGRWPNHRTYREQREIVSQLIRTLFGVWDEKERLRARLAEVERERAAA